jgi:hypothetical protein
MIFWTYGMMTLLDVVLEILIRLAVYQMIS